MFKPVKLVLALAAAAGLLLSCEGERYHLENTSVNAVVTVSLSDIGASGAVANIASPQDNVVSYKVVGPLEYSAFPYKEKDSSALYDYITDNGRSMDGGALPITGLKPQTSYVLGAYGLDAAGTVVTAPAFVEFKTFVCSVSVTGAYEIDKSGAFNFSADIVPNEYTDHFDYVFSKEVAGMDEAALTKLIKAKGADIKTGKGTTHVTVSYPSKADAVIAVLPYDEGGNAGNLVSAYISSDDRCVVLIGGKENLLTKAGESIFEAKVKMPATGEFTIALNGDEYGFLSYSGNGGVGTVNNVKAAAPYYNWAEGHELYQAGKSVGRMGLISDGANKFWSNMAAEAEVLIRADFSKEVPQYRFEVQEAADPSVLIKQTFDLFVWGGNYADPIKGSAPGGAAIGSVDVIKYDGTEVAVPNAVATTSGGTDPFSYDEGVEENLCTAEFVHNRDLDGWTFINIAELPGSIRLSKASDGFQGYIRTPKLSALTGPTDITVSFDCGRYGNNAGDIEVTIIGEGEFTAASVAPTNAGDLPMEASGKTFYITQEVCPPYANSVVHKPWSHVVLSVKGATPDTQIIWDSRKLAKGVCRIRLDNIIIKK